ncbi:hypothetical protein [Cognatishimia sp. F0-27]|uniref:hypothetical protein n=1 Tax=Cognatishimia sp. F0-27 TaxID=2816855 RepID=UPI001D0C5BB4|nr:hypothetical protein [Cognatishimia sp. F0-27]MCC1494949.1 hypothetical protein [Cognatishimia sp. F0-27]
MSINYTEAEARMHFYADTIGVQPPGRLLSDDGAPAPELLNFCVRCGASLDWIFLGDVRGMIRDSYKVARNTR